MSNSYHNPPGLFPPYANYAHAVETPPNSRTLYVSGLNAFEADGVSMPGSFEGQAHVVWDHLGLVLDAAGMTYSDLVSLRFYLAATADDRANVEILRSRLGTHVAARTVISCTLLEPEWLIEIEAVAARVD